MMQESYTFPPTIDQSAVVLFCGKVYYPRLNQKNAIASDRNEFVVLHCSSNNIRLSQENKGHRECCG